MTHPLAESLHLAANCVFIAVEENVASDIAAKMHEAAAELDRQAERVGELERQVRCYQSECADVCQELGKALGYPWYKDDQKNFPGATEADGVCVGEHVPGSIALEAARRIRELETAEAEMRERAAQLVCANLSIVLSETARNGQVLLAAAIRALKLRGEE